MKKIVFRSATPEDAPLIVHFLTNLAADQDLAAEAMGIDEEALARHLAPEASPQMWAILAEYDNRPVGVAIYYLRYSTFSTSWGIHFEDLYVMEEYRKMGIGRAFFVVLARLAKKHGYPRIDFNVLNWNPARSLYKRVGAKELNEWIPMRLEGEELELLVTHPELQAIRIPH